ncbi:MAG TPA: APC family permease [Candidatus Brevibacterium intestinigallinarum]|nr:APC family permease [Candidatus Brevibacterium intestinigallinarum]
MSDRNPSAVSSQTEEPGLKKVLGPGLLLLFIVGDILGTGVYALTGQVAGQVGGAGWAPLLLAFGIAMLTALSYLELVTKYPRAAGAALYAHKAFGIHFVTFLVAFAVLCSGITSATTAARAVAANLLKGLGYEPGLWAPLIIALVFLLMLAAINLRGVSESVWFNVFLTCVELTGLLLVIGVGFIAVFQGDADFSRAVIFETEGDKSVFLAITGATALGFFALVGFEDSVNMVEETKDPSIFPKILITGLSLTAVVYVLVSVIAVAVVPVGQLATSETPLLDVVAAGAPGLPIDDIFPYLTIFAVANTALINMLMASRLLYGMANQRVLPAVFGKVLPGRRSPWVAILFTTLLACGLLFVVSVVLPDGVVGALGGTTALLLLAVFAIVNIAVLVLRKDANGYGDGSHFRTPTILPWLGAATSLFLVGPWARMDALIQYQIAGALLGIGILLWAFEWSYNRSRYGRSTRFRRPDEI